MDSAFGYFEQNLSVIEKSLRSVSKKELDSLLQKCVLTLNDGKKIVVTGLGKNIPICQKFVSTMISMGLDACFIDAVSALHGDIGIVKPGDMVIVLTKSSMTAEIVNLVEVLKKREVCYWIITNNRNGTVARETQNIVYAELEHEGDIWNIIPNNSTTVNLMILQTVAVRVSELLGLSLEKNFKPNHPGGTIGAELYNDA